MLNRLSRAAGKQPFRVAILSATASNPSALLAPSSSSRAGLTTAAAAAAASPSPPAIQCIAPDNASPAPAPAPPRSFRWFKAHGLGCSSSGSSGSGSGAVLQRGSNPQSNLEAVLLHTTQPASRRACNAAANLPDAGTVGDAADGAAEGVPRLVGAALEQDLDDDRGSVVFQWSDGVTAAVHPTWLRHNCQSPESIEPSSGQVRY